MEAQAHAQPQLSNKRASYPHAIWIAALVLVWGLQIEPIHYLNPYFYTILMYAGINCILAVSLNMVNGFTGQFSMGHAGFMAVGGYVAAFITTNLEHITDVPLHTTLAGQGVFLVALLAGGVAAGGIGYLVGLPSLRLKGDYLAIVTLGFGEIIRVVVLNLNVVGGARGLPNIPAFSQFGWIFTFVILTVFTSWRLLHSRFGRSFLAVREDEIAAEAMGVHSTKAKVRAFTIGAFFAGIAGGLFAHFLRYLNPQTFDFNRSFEIIIMVVLGGMGSISGAIIAAFLLTFMREALRPLQELTQLDFRMIIYSLLLIILMLTRPNGLLGTKELPDIWKKYFRRRV